MLINDDPDEWETVSEFRACPWHERHPSIPHLGCTCMASVGRRRRDPAEVARLKAERRKKEEGDILARAERISERRAAEAALAEPDGNLVRGPPMKHPEAERMRRSGVHDLAGEWLDRLLSDRDTLRHHLSCFAVSVATNTCGDRETAVCRMCGAVAYGRHPLRHYRRCPLA